MKKYKIKKCATGVQSVAVPPSGDPMSVLSGATSGAAMGTQVGGPLGALAGGVIGGGLEILKMNQANKENALAIKTNKGIAESNRYSNVVPNTQAKQYPGGAKKIKIKAPSASTAAESTGVVKGTKPSKLITGLDSIKDKETREYLENTQTAIYDGGSAQSKEERRLLANMHYKNGNPIVRKQKDSRASFYSDTNEIATSYDDPTDYTAELAHAKQLKEQGPIKYTTRALIGKNLYEDSSDPKKGRYGVPGTLENEAHRTIEPQLVDELNSLPSKASKNTKILKATAAPAPQYPGGSKSIKTEKTATKKDYKSVDQESSDFYTSMNDVIKRSQVDMQKLYPGRKVEVRLNQGKRSVEEQQRHVKSGASRTELSMHNIGMAGDVGVYVDGKMVNDDKAYQVMGHHAKQAGHFWGWNWDKGHVGKYANVATAMRKNPNVADHPVVQDFKKKYGPGSTVPEKYRTTLHVADSLAGQPDQPRNYVGGKGNVTKPDSLLSPLDVNAPKPTVAKAKTKVIEIEKKTTPEIHTDKNFNIKNEGKKPHTQGGTKVVAKEGDVVFPTQNDPKKYKEVKTAIANGDTDKLKKIQASLPEDKPMPDRTIKTKPKQYKVDAEAGQRNMQLEASDRKNELELNQIAAQRKGEKFTKDVSVKPFKPVMKQVPTVASTNSKTGDKSTGYWNRVTSNQTTADPRRDASMDKLLHPSKADGVLDYLHEGLSFPAKSLNHQLTGYFEGAGTTAKRYDPKMSGLKEFGLNVVSDPLMADGLIDKGLVKGADLGVQAAKYAAPKVVAAAEIGAKYAGKAADAALEYGGKAVELAKKIPIEKLAKYAIKGKGKISQTIMHYNETNPTVAQVEDPKKPEKKVAVAKSASDASGGKVATATKSNAQANYDNLPYKEVTLKDGSKAKKSESGAMYYPNNRVSYGGGKSENWSGDAIALAKKYATTPNQPAKSNTTVMPKPNTINTAAPSVAPSKYTNAAVKTSKSSSVVQPMKDNKGQDMYWDENNRNTKYNGAAELGKEGNVKMSARDPNNPYGKNGIPVEVVTLTNGQKRYYKDEIGPTGIKEQPLTPGAAPTNATTLAQVKVPELSKEAKAETDKSLKTKDGFDIGAIGKYAGIANNLIQSFKKPEKVNREYMTPDQLKYEDMSEATRRESRSGAAVQMSNSRNISGGSVANMRANSNAAVAGNAERQDKINQFEAGRASQVNNANVGIRNQAKQYNNAKYDQYEQMDAASRAAKDAYRDTAMNDISKVAQINEQTKYMKSFDQKQLDMQERTINMANTVYKNQRIGENGEIIFKGAAKTITDQDKALKEGQYKYGTKRIKIKSKKK